jgi:hypothetical protein
MWFPSLARPVVPGASGRAVVLCRSSVVLTPSGSDRPTTFRLSTHNDTRERSTGGRAPSSLRRHGPRAAACANSLAAAGWWGSVTQQRPPTGRGHDRQGDTDNALNSGRERVTVTSEKVNPLAIQAVPVGCRRVVSCPILDTAGLALRPPVGGFPAPIRAQAPRAGRRLFWAASLAPPTTKQEEQR